MLKKKLIIPIIFTLILFLSMLTGCIDIKEIKNRTTPVSTLYTEADPYTGGETWLKLYGGWAGFYCLAKNRMIVVDNESHENWEDYEYQFNTGIQWPFNFCRLIERDEIPGGPGPDYFYYRAVAYCYNFKFNLSHYEDGWYQGEEKRFSISW